MKPSSRATKSTQQGWLTAQCGLSRKEQHPMMKYFVPRGILVRPWWLKGDVMMGEDTYYDAMRGVEC